MKTGFSRLVVLVDRSGSMESVRSATVAGINEFIVSQKAQPGDAKLKIVQFDDNGGIQYDVIVDKAVGDVTLITEKDFTPRGGTPLYDAIGRTINELGLELSTLTEEERPERIVVAIVTDGYENASKEFKVAQIRSMIKHQTDTYNWNFTYIGANQDAVLTAESFGIGAASAMSFTADTIHTKNAFRGMGNYANAVRCSTSLESARNVQYSKTDRLDSLADFEKSKANVPDIPDASDDKA